MRYSAAVLAFLLILGIRSASAQVALSDDEMDWVSAEGVSIVPFVVTTNTTTNTLSPTNITTLTSTNIITSTNTVVQVCTFSVCLGAGPIATSANAIQSVPSIVSPQFNSLLNSVQTPTVANFGFPSLGVPSVQVPTVQVPSVSIRFQ